MMTDVISLKLASGWEVTTRIFQAPDPVELIVTVSKPDQ